jgi:hypothetical protein
MLWGGIGGAEFDRGASKKNVVQQSEQTPSHFKE